MKTCIAYPNRQVAYSETFIQKHIDLLPWDFQLTHGAYPCLTPAGEPLLTFPFNNALARGSCKKISPHFYEKLYTKRLSRWLKEQKIKVVLAEYGTVGANVADACYHANTKLIVHFHGFDATHQPTLKRYMPKYKRMFAYCHKIVCVSADMRQQLKSLGASENRLVLNPYGIDIQQFSGSVPANSPPIFVAVGRFTPKKAPHLTLKAFAQVLTQCPDAQLVMIGQGELWQACQGIAQELGIKAQVHFKGVLSPAEVIAQLRQARAFVQHSVVAPNGDTEGTPNSILEASAMGLPIISTQHAGIKQAVLHQETGFLVPEHDWQAMAKYMIVLAQNPTLAQQLGQAGQKHIAKHYNLQQSIAHLKRICEEA